MTDINDNVKVRFVLDCWKTSVVVHYHVSMQVKKLLYSYKSVQ